MIFLSDGKPSLMVMSHDARTRRQIGVKTRNYNARRNHNSDYTIINDFSLSFGIFIYFLSSSTHFVWVILYYPQPHPYLFRWISTSVSTTLVLFSQQEDKARFGFDDLFVSFVGFYSFQAILCLELIGYHYLPYNHIQNNKWASLSLCAKASTLYNKIIVSNL